VCLQPFPLLTRSFLVMNGLFKTELLYNPAVLERHDGSWKGLADLEAAILAWVEWFNERRIHGELSYCTPAEVELAYAESLHHAA
jgi:putative transposase